MDKTNKYRNHSFICKQCQESFIQKNHKKLGTVSFCSRKCKAKSLTTPSIKKNCINCNSEYLCSIQQENRSSFCNRKCLEIHRNNKKVGVCDWCEQDVRRRAMFVSDKMFCSHRCQSD